MASARRSMPNIEAADVDPLISRRNHRPCCRLPQIRPARSSTAARTHTRPPQREPKPARQMALLRASPWAKQRRHDRRRQRSERDQPHNNMLNVFRHRGRSFLQSTECDTLIENCVLHHRWLQRCFRRLAAAVSTNRGSCSMFQIRHAPAGVSRGYCACGCSTKLRCSASSSNIGGKARSARAAPSRTRCPATSTSDTAPKSATAPAPPRKPPP